MQISLIILSHLSYLLPAADDTADPITPVRWSTVLDLETPRIVENPLEHKKPGNSSKKTIYDLQILVKWNGADQMVLQKCVTRNMNQIVVIYARREN